MRVETPGSRVHRARGLSSPGDYYHAADHGLAPRCRRRTTAAQTCRSVLQVMTAANGMSMFDYDARPVTPQVVLVGNRASSVGYTIRDFLSRNGVPYDWVDLDDAERVRALVSPSEMDPGVLPICILPNGIRLAPATLEDVAAGLGMMSAPSLSEYDLTIVGAGPAGLAAAVYAASEGLRTLAVEAIAPGGQAGTTSMIENYLGFPQAVRRNHRANTGPASGERGRLASTRDSRARRSPGFRGVLRSRPERGCDVYRVPRGGHRRRELSRPGRRSFL